MTELEKRIYNKHMAISRSIRKKAYRLRENFKDFEEDSKYPYVKKLAIFFSRYPEVNMDMYFSAPYKLYLDVDYFDLQYFASPRAIKTYTIYKQELSKLSPEQHSEDVKKSLSFIGKYCISNKIQFDDYIGYTKTGIHPVWVYHIKNGDINIYSLMEFPNILEHLNEIPEEEQQLFFGKTNQDFFTLKTNYIHSKLKPFLRTAYEKIRSFVEKVLKSS